jgi:hypothetical protein
MEGGSHLLCTALLIWDRLTAPVTRLGCELLLTFLVAGPDLLPDHGADARQVRLERTVSERLAEATGFTQHIPRTNSVEEPPSYSELSLDRKRLKERLAMYSLCEREVKGDGNCQVGLSVRVFSAGKTCWTVFCRYSDFLGVWRRVCSGVRIKAFGNVYAQLSPAGSMHLICS